MLAILDSICLFLRHFNFKEVDFNLFFSMWTVKDQLKPSDSEHNLGALGYV